MALKYRRHGKKRAAAKKVGRGKSWVPSLSSASKMAAAAAGVLAAADFVAAVFVAAVVAVPDLAVLVLAVVVFTAPALAPAGFGAADLPPVAVAAPVLGLGGALGLAVLPVLGAALALLALAAGLLVLSSPSTAGPPLPWAGSLALLLALRVLTWMVSPDVVATIRISGRSVLTDAATGLMGMGRRGMALRAASMSRGKGSRREGPGTGLAGPGLGQNVRPGAQAGGGILMKEPIKLQSSPWGPHWLGQRRDQGAVMQDAPSMPSHVGAARQVGVPGDWTGSRRVE